jgi:hypothetical protein
LIIKRVVSLRLSNDNETPDLPNHFLRDHFTIDRFINLKYLKLHAFHSDKLLLKILSDCHHLPYLTHLKITECSFSDDYDVYDLMKNIWRLPKLTYCYLGTSFCNPTDLREPTLISSETIKYLFMENIQLSSNNLIELLALTPNLQHVCATLRDGRVFLQSLPVMPLITRLNLSIDCPPFLLSKLFEIMPNLSYVTLVITGISDYTYLNGDYWKQIIINCLSNIKVFRFFTGYYFSQEINLENRIDEILNTFRTPFWLDEHRWFVRCEWAPKYSSRAISLYTLPHCCENIYALVPPVRSKSTCPEIQDQCLFNDVCHIISKNRVLPNLLSILSPKVVHLKIELPINHNVWSFISTLDYLTSLEVSLNCKTDLSQLQTLINRASCLYSLTVNKASVSQLVQLNIGHARLRRVSLENYYYNAPECSLIARSSLGRQCEVLSIAVTDRRNVPDLVTEMPNLRALTCFCEDNKWDVDESLSIENVDAITWLHDHLPSTCLISKHGINKSYIRVWFE